MNKKTEVLVSTITSAVASIAIGIVTFIAPVHMVAINASIGVIEGAVLTIIGLFSKKE